MVLVMEVQGRPPCPALARGPASHRGFSPQAGMAAGGEGALAWAWFEGMLSLAFSAQDN